MINPFQLQAITNPTPTITKPGSGVWHTLRSEREGICEMLLKPAASNELTKTLLQTRLRLIDTALDRLMNGTYGDCIKCGRWIDDEKLHLDAAQPFCCACAHEQEQIH